MPAADSAGQAGGPLRCVTTLPAGAPSATGLTTGRRRPADSAPAALTLLGLGSVCARAYLTIVGGLLFWTLVPMLFGLSSVIVRTGSMQPAVRPGDVLVIQHVPTSSIRPGQVILTVNPARPGQLLSHRVAKVNPDGEFVTRGDANETADSTPVAPGLVKGLARLRIPFIGQPAVWWWEGRRGVALVWVALSGLAVLLTGAGPAGAARERSADVTGGHRSLVLKGPGRHRAGDLSWCGGGRLL